MNTIVNFFLSFIASVSQVKKGRLHLFCIFLLAFFPSTSFGEITFVHVDSRGSVIAETDEDGDLIDTYHYEPFGKALSSRPDNSVGYAGHVYDNSLGLSYMQARYYDPQLGRFYSNDPVDYLGHLQRGNSDHGFNRYTYANNNPYKYVDPDGEFAFLAWFATPPGIAALTKAGEITIIATTATIAALAANDMMSESSNSDDSSSDPVGELIGSTTPGEKTKGRTTNHEKPGNIDTANDDFDKIVDPDSVEDRGNGVRTGKTEDGRKVNVRPNSSDGRPTIEIQDGKKKDKIRYDEP